MNAGTTRGTISTRAVDLDAVGRLPFDNGFGLMGKLGIERATAKPNTALVSAQTLPSRYGTKRSATGLLWGVGATYDFNPNVSADLGWNALQQNQANPKHRFADFRSCLLLRLIQPSNEKGEPRLPFFYAWLVVSKALRKCPVTDAGFFATCSGVPYSNNFSPAASAFGPKINDPIRSFDHFKIVLNDHQGISLLAQTVQNRQKLLDIVKMQTVVGSSSKYKVRPVSRFASSLASFTR